MLKMVMNKEVSKVVIAYPDNKVWILLEEFFKSYGTEIAVINKEENKFVWNEVSQIQEGGRRCKEAHAGLLATK